MNIKKKQKKQRSGFMRWGNAFQKLALSSVWVRTTAEWEAFPWQHGNSSVREWGGCVCLARSSLKWFSLWRGAAFFFTQRHERLAAVKGPDRSDLQVLFLQQQNRVTDPSCKVLSCSRLTADVCLRGQVLVKPSKDLLDVRLPPIQDGRHS